jgi:N-hydroxyarylamine O-acetyltransferase
MAPLSSLDAYLARIGLAGRTDVSMAEAHRAHAASIPFENFDSYSGRPVSLEQPDLEDKMVARGRGGYCFEHNLLFTAACESLGAARVDQLLARVRIAPEENGGRPLNHLLLRVTDSQGTWLADVGFGGGGLVDPLPFELSVETEQSGWRYRLVEDGPEWVLQVFQDGGWTDMYGFIPEPAPYVDIVVNNWYTSTHPASMFVNAVMAGIRRSDRCLTLFVFDDGMLVERPVGGASSVTPVPLSDVPALLAERFAMTGVSVGDGGRLVLAEA